MDEINKPNPAPQNQPPVQGPAKKFTTQWGIIAGVAALLIISSALAYLQGHKKPVENLAVNNPLPVTGNHYPPPANITQPGEPNYPISTPPLPNVQAPDPLATLNCNNLGPTVSGRSGQVQWMDPKLIATNIFLMGDSNDSGYTGDYSYLVGHFVSGKYQGADLLLAVVNVSEMGPGQYWLHMVKQGKNYIILDQYSDNRYYDISFKDPTFKLSEDKNFDLPDLDVAKTLHSVSPAADFNNLDYLGFYRNGSRIFCADNLIKVFTDSSMGDVYTDIPSAQEQNFSNGFYVKLPDGMMEAYELNIPFVVSGNVPSVSFNGKQNSQEYGFKAVGGCGASMFMDVWDVKLSELTQIGATFDGQPIYGYRDSNNSELKLMYDELYVPDGQTKPSYTAFLADHPIFFWQDQFGQFVRFKSTKYQPLAECAKPVIYLYPQNTEKISVQIDPKGGWLKSEPNYNNGWNVLADPNSNITNLADGKTYPYLFWEGRGGMYQTPTKGFVTDKAHVHDLLEEKLALAGLNQKERKDFEDFWEPKMQSAPYYFVTFMGNSVMDQLAPLSVTPKPDTVIRILMDFTPLNYPISAQGYNIAAPQRKGFTVVEWGGVLR